MPFQSKAQERAAFGGYLGSEMKAKSQQWADETPDQKSLPEHKNSLGKKKTMFKNHPFMVKNKMNG